MRGSFSIGRLFGIPIRVHWTLIALMALWMLVAPSALQGVRAVLATVLVFASVLLHELGHALVARKRGVDTKEIVLLPLGGAAMLAERPKTPRDEFVIAAAGPLVSLVLGGLGFIASLAAPEVEVLADIANINLMLGLFNLVPAFPLDGGRMLRAALETRLGTLRATRIAARIGRALALVGFGLAVYFSQPVLAFIAVFVFMTATNEERSQLLVGIVSRRSVHQAMERVLEGIPAGVTVPDALRLLAAQPRLTALPVTFGARIVGVVHRQPLLAAAAHGELGAIGTLVDRNVVTQDGDGPLMALLVKMQEAQSPTAVITEGSEVRGIITVEKLAETFRAAAEGS